MLSFGALAFLNPWVLAGLAALPVLWWLLRAIPPSPKRQAFAPVRLLLGLEDPDREADRTPWWLIVLRVAAVTAALIGFAQPMLNPQERLAADAPGPVLMLIDQGWASAPDWEARRDTATAALDELGEAGQPVMVWTLGRGGMPPVAAPKAMRPVIEGTEPVPWRPDRAQVLAALERGEIPEPGQTLWLHDGLGHDAPATEALLDRLSEAGPLRLIGPETPARAVTPPRLEETRLAADVLRTGGGPERIGVVAIAETEEGAERRIGVARASFAAGETRATVLFDLPPELIGDVSRLVLAERPSAGGAALAGGAIRRVAAAVVDPQADSIATSLTSAEHYLKEALVPWADVRTGALPEMLERDPAAILLADYGQIAPQLHGPLADWVRAGGLLIRFAGPRLAAAISERFGAMQADNLLPVRLRRGGRVLGGTLTWSRPRRLGPFAEEGPFRRLTAPDEVDVRMQVLAEPGPDLAGRVWASLEDGTPLVTANSLGEGQLVLFHVTADPEWSSLPLSGLFVEMLGKLMALAPGQVPERPAPEALAGTLWRADTLMGADGTPYPASGLDDPVPGTRIAESAVGPELPPGLYIRADSAPRAAGQAGEILVNLTSREDSLASFPDPPSGAVIETLGGAEAERLGHWFLIGALGLALIDILAALAVSGRLTRAAAPRAATVLAAVALAGWGEPVPAQPADPGRAVEATAETTLGYILTGERRIDRISERALIGLGNALTRRTAVEPGPPMGVDLETDPLAVFPVLYWPLSAEAVPSETALDRLAGFLSGGGLLLIDTRDGASGFSGASGAQMRQIARVLNLPPLAPVDEDHVLTRTFYLLDRFPGRWRGGRVWAEAPPPGATRRQRDPAVPQFDRIDDNVSPVVVGSADWAAAWAVDDGGRAMFPIGRPGGRQREMAVRFGINLVLYALTGNYKSDQVHAPEVLRRLGQ